MMQWVILEMRSDTRSTEAFCVLVEGTTEEQARLCVAILNERQDGLEASMKPSDRKGIGYELTCVPVFTVEDVK